jgi:hypothetical protein
MVSTGGKIQKHDSSMHVERARAQQISAGKFVSKKDVKQRPTNNDPST